MPAGSTDVMWLGHYLVPFAVVGAIAVKLALDLTGGKRVLRGTRDCLDGQSIGEAGTPLHCDHDGGDGACHDGGGHD